MQEEAAKEPTEEDLRALMGLTPSEQFVTLLHELGHLFCGNVDAFMDNNTAADEYGSPDRCELPKATKEIEAELVAWWLADREDLTTGSPLYLRSYLQTAGGDVTEVDLDRVTAPWRGSAAISGTGCDRRMINSPVDLLEKAAYLNINRTRPASVRKDMHTWAGLLFSGSWH